MQFPTYGHLTVDDWRVLTSPESPMKQKEVRALVREIPKIFNESLIAANNQDFGFEEAGQLTGLWIGIVWGIATLPMVALDGPLPIMDVAWLAGWSAFTLRAVGIGGYIGSTIDDMLED